MIGQADLTGRSDSLFIILGNDKDRIIARPAFEILSSYKVQYVEIA